MRPRHMFLLVIVLLVIFSTCSPAEAQDSRAIVHAVLFYSPSCGHCHYVMTETLPPLLEKYGEQLQIIAVDVTQAQGQTLFLAALQKFGLEGGGVPFLVIDDLYLVGSLDIPEQFPGLIEAYLGQGGVDWPDIPGLHEMLAAQAESEMLQATPEPATVSPSSSSPSGLPDVLPAGSLSLNWMDRFANDPSGNTLAVLVLASMLVSLGWVVLLFQRNRGVPSRTKLTWVIPVLCLIGMGVAGYLAYVETTQTTAVCGPVGDCNTVQQSEYARLFGILPIGLLGLVGYLVILAAWFFARYAPSQQADIAVIILLLMTVFGALFSVYLTFLEPFVIGATCAWCLTSAVLMTLLMLLSAGAAKQALFKLIPTSPHRRRMRNRV